jgi:membrane protein DedA with SNARE-associated domain
MNFQHYISQYGYVAVFVLMLIESACIPIPSEVIMLFGGALSAGALSTGSHPALIGIVIAGVLGNVAGSYLAWAVGKYAGQAAVRRWGRKVGIREHEIDRATAWFERHGPVAVLVGRIVPVIRTFISLPAGFAGMPAVSFGIFTTLGCIPWTAALAIAGYALGANWQTVANDFHGPTYIIAGIVVVAIVAALIIWRRRRRSEDTGAQPAAASGQPGQAAPYGAPAGPGYRESGYRESGYPRSRYPGEAQSGYPGQSQPDYPGPAGNPGGGGWGPGAGSPPAGGPDGRPPAGSPWDPDSRQYR